MSALNQATSKATNTTSNATSATSSQLPAGLGSITSTLQGGISTLTSSGTNLINNILPPSRREDIKSKLINFANTYPHLASFLLSHIVISGIPLALFIIFVIGITIFALLTALIVSILGILLFILVAVGFALVILLPTLFVTTFLAVGVWLFGVGAYYLIKWYNEESLPGVHEPLIQGVMGKVGLEGVNSIDDLPVIGKNVNGGQTKQNRDLEKKERNGDTTEIRTKTNDNGNDSVTAPKSNDLHDQRKTAYVEDSVESGPDSHEKKKSKPKKLGSRDNSKTRHQTEDPANVVTSTL